MRAFFAFILTVLGLAALALYSSAFIVHQNEQALVLRFGEPQQVDHDARPQMEDALRRHRREV